MLIVLAVTSTSVNTTTVLMDAMSVLMLPSMEMKPSWKLRSLSARTSAAEFWNAAFTALMTGAMSLADFTLSHHMPT